MCTTDNCWISRDIEGRRILMSYQFTEDSYVVRLCDLTAVFAEEVQGQQVLQKNMDLNPNIETNLQKILTFVKSSLDLSSHPLKILKANGDEIQLESYHKVEGVRFIWRFCASLCEPTVMKDMLLSPLLAVVAELLGRQKKLTDCIKKKDEEIEDYKNNGASLSRAYLKTEKFSEEEFLCTDKVVKGNEEDTLKTVFSGLGQSLLKAVSEASPVLPDCVIPIEKVKQATETIEEDTTSVISQMDVELKRRQELTSIPQKVKTKKKKVFKL